MPDNYITIQLQTTPTNTGFEILAITAGIAKGHDLDFGAQVLRDSLSLWDNIPCILDHPGFLEGPSVRDLAGSLHSPAWNEQAQGIQVHTQPADPGADVLASLRGAALQDPAIMQAVGFSAVVRVELSQSAKSACASTAGTGVKSVKSVVQVASVDCVINPARGGKF